MIKNVLIMYVKQAPRFALEISVRRARAGSIIIIMFLVMQVQVPLILQQASVLKSNLKTFYMNWLFIQLLTFFTSIYSFTINNTDGNVINFTDFQNKKILLVNIATGSERAGQ